MSYEVPDGFVVVEWVDVEHDGTADKGKPIEVKVSRWTLLDGNGSVVNGGDGTPTTEAVAEAAGQAINDAITGLARIAGGAHRG